MGKLFWINITAFGLAYCGAVLSEWLRLPGLHILLSALFLFTLFPLTGLNLVIIIEKLTRSKFDWLEKINIAALLALVFLPFLLTLEYSKFHIFFPSLPFINSLVIFLIAISTNPLALERISVKAYFKETITRSLLLATLFYTVIILIITLSYYALPDLDPYYWLTTYNDSFTQNKIVYITQYRPLFASLTYIFNQTAQVDIYAYFKYIVPFLTLLVLFPASLVARIFHGTLQQLAILLLPIVSASFLLYYQIPIPQAILNITLTYFVFFLIYSWLSQRHFFYYLAGFGIFGAYFYHEAAALVLLPWFVVTLWRYRQTIIDAVRRQKLAALLILLLILSYATLLLSPIAAFLLTWTNSGLHLIQSSHTNFSFPATYINIDGNAVGWGDGLGVFKYYAFYVGPTIFITLILSLGLLISFRSIRSSEKTTSFQLEFIVLGVCFLLFFIIAEILPRFFNVALLPERAWGFAGLFLLSLVPIFFKQYSKYSKHLALLLIVTMFINIGGALYINNLKKYLITPAQMTSAEWISGALPVKRVFFSYGHDNLLRVFSQSSVVGSNNPEFYADIRAFDAALETFIANHQGLDQRFIQELTTLTFNLRELRGRDLQSDTKYVTTTLDSISSDVEKLKTSIEANAKNQEEKLAPIYIYYAKTSDKNPYALRPYIKSDNTEVMSSFIFDQYPKRFKRIYALPDNEVIIWQSIDHQ
jgi:hypothetical protein